MLKKISLIMAMVMLLTSLLSIGNVSFAQTKSTEFEYVLFESDFENHNLYNRPDTAAGDMSKWTQDGNVSTPFQVSVADDGGNKVLKLHRNSDESPDAPCIIKRLIVDENSKINIRYNVKTFGEFFELQLYTLDEAGARVVTKTAQFSGEDVVSPGPLSGKIPLDEFLTVDVVVDFFNQTCTTFINGLQYKEASSFKAGTDFSKGYYVRFNAKPQPGKSIYLDDVRITTDNEALLTAKLLELDTITYEDEEDILSLLKKSHPRIYFNDFEDVKKKIESDPLCRSWYNSIISSADTYLESEPEAFIENSSQALSGARRIRYKLHILGFAFAMTGDVRYRDRAIEEIVHAGEYPTWNSYLATAELTNGVGVAYDWMYNGMTEEQRKLICDIMLEKGLYYAAMSYEGISDSYFVKTDSNQNMACNGCYMTTAIAFADELPELCGYILDKGAQSLPTGVAILAPAGASPEGYQYWDYSLSNVFQIQAALESALKPGAVLPQKYDFVSYPGVSTTIDYYIALRSTYGAFNYGDADIGTPGWGEFSFSYWAAEKFDKPEYAWYEYNKCDLNGIYGSVWRLTHKLAYYDPQTVPLIESSFPLDKAFQSEDATNVATMRSSWASENEVYVGIQGGGPGITHMFQSLGTFVIDANNERWATMRGRGDYNWPGYFDIEQQKWTYYTARTEGQNCVVINPDKSAGQNINAVAAVKDFVSNPNEVYATVDLTEAYNENVESYIRGTKLFDNREKILVQDDIKAKEVIKEGYWFMHTDAEIIISDDGKSAMLFKNGKRMYMEIVSGHEDARLTVVDAKPLPQSPNPEIQWDVDYGRKLSIDISGTKDLSLAVLFVPLKASEATSRYDISVTPISEWSPDTNSGISSELTGSVALYANSPYAYRGDMKTYIDSAQKDAVTPIIKNGRTLVPIRFISEALGAEVTWSDAENTAYINLNGNSVAIPIGKDFMLVNGEQKSLDVPAEVIYSRTMVPLRAVSDALGKKVYWNDNGLIAVGTDTISQNVADRLKGMLGYSLYLDDELLYDANINDGNLCYNASFKNGESTLKLVSYYPDVTSAERNVNSSDNNAEFKLDNGTLTIGLYNDEYLYFGGKKAIRDMWITNTEFADKRSQVTWLEPISVTATGEQTPVENIIDNNINTLWTAQGANYVDYDFGKNVNLHSVAIAIDSRGTRNYSFKIQVSDDGKNWTDILPDTRTTIYTDLPEIFKLGDVSARYARLVANGNTANDYNNYYELRYYESREQEDLDVLNWHDYFGKVDWSNLKVGDTMQLDTRAYCMDGSPADFSDATVSYKSSDSAVVSVSTDGKLTCKKTGTASITALVSYHGISKEIVQSVVIKSGE